MNRTTRSTVMALAAEVRRWAEEKAGDWRPDLCGYCAISSAELWKRLRAAGVDSEIHMAASHWGAHIFLVVQDWIVDVTATQFPQFSHKPIVVLHTREGEVFDFYQSYQTFRNAEELRKTQLAEGWPKNQVALAKSC